MIIVMKRHAAPEEINAVVQHIEAFAPWHVLEPGETRRRLLWVSHVQKTDASHGPAGSGSRTLCLRRICH